MKSTPRFVSFVATLTLSLCFVVCSACTAAPRFTSPADNIARVVELIDARLALMDDVAVWKWRQQQAIADPERERRVVQAMSIQAAEYGFEAAPTRAFFELLIELARDIQTRRFEEWRAQSTPPGAVPKTADNRQLRDLNTDIRPTLDAIGKSLLRALYAAAPDLNRDIDDARIASALQRIAARFPEDADVSNRLRQALRGFNVPQAGRLRAIRAAKILRIGTTGDYAPFSIERDGELRGMDIELAVALAGRLGVEPVFVQTSWSTLMDDLQQRRFDIAVGGISVTPEREAVATFSTAYHIDGKTPIARCSDRMRYATLGAIDRPTVRVIVNPGGTNERFARQHLSRAQLRVHPDNRTVFEEIVAGRADVMVTDATEVELQTHRHPQLCATTSQRFTSTSKAMLMPRDADLASFAGNWLRESIARGTVRAALQRALGAEKNSADSH